MISISSAALADLEQLVGELVDCSITFEPATKRLHMLAEKHGWDWFGLEPRVDFNWRAGLLLRAVSYSRYCGDRWAELDENGYPFRIFRTGAECGEAHQELDGLVLPSDHAFWRSYNPPLGWDCGCYVTGARSETAARRLGGDPDRSLGLLPNLDSPWSNGQLQLLDLLDAIAQRAIPDRETAQGELDC